MSGRPGLPAGVATAAGLDHAQHFPLVRMEFDVADGGTLALAGTDFPVVYGGVTYLATGPLATMETIAETPDEITGIKFSLFCDDATVSSAQQVKYQGRPCTVLWAFLNGSTLYVDPAAWQGRLDVPEIRRGMKERVISVTAEHRMADWGRTRRLLFNDADQRRIDPTDTFFLGVESMKERTINLFSKEALKQAGRA